MKIIEKISEYKVLEFSTLIVSVCALCVSVCALNNSRNAYRLSSVDYSPNIRITNSTEEVKIFNEDTDLFTINMIKILGEHSYSAIVNNTDYVEESIPFIIRDYYYRSPMHDVNLDNISISLKDRYQNGIGKYSDERIILNYNHIIDTGLKKLQAKPNGLTLKIIIGYKNKHNYHSNNMLLAYHIDDRGYGKIYEMAEEELYEEIGNLFALSDNVHLINETWNEVELYIQGRKDSGDIGKVYKNTN